MSDATFARPDLTTFCRLDDLGLEVVGQQLQTDRAVLACRVTDPDRWCRRCGCQGVPRDRVTRRLAYEPFGWRPTTLVVTVCHYRCSGCGHVWRQDTSRAAEPRAKLTRGGLRWALSAIVLPAPHGRPRPRRASESPGAPPTIPAAGDVGCGARVTRAGSSLGDGTAMLGSARSP